MAIIDSRLKDCDTDQDVTENFNRVLGLLDKGGSSKVKFVTLNENMELNCTPNDVEQWLEETDYELQIIIKTVSQGNISFIQVNAIVENENNHTLVTMSGAMTSQFNASGKDKNYKYVQSGGN